MVNRIIDSAVTLSAISKEPVISEDCNPEIGEEDIAQCIMSKLFLCHVLLFVCMLTQGNETCNLSTRDCSKFISRKITEYFKCNMYFKNFNLFSMKIKLIGEGRIKL